MIEKILKEGSDVELLILKHALKNAVKHGGKAKPGPVISAIIAERKELRNNVKEIAKIVGQIVAEVNKLSKEEQERILQERFPDALTEERKEERRGLPPLPNAREGNVVTRFAPNPDFHMTLGNVRPAILSYEYAKMYKGKFILRFEDTDPRTKRPYPDAYLSVEEDLKWLGVKWDEKYIQSLRMEVYYQYGKKLIELGGAYVCECPPELWKQYRDQRRPCPHRDRPVEDNLYLFEKMIEGALSEGEAVVRVKTDMSHPDPSVRDWVAFRIINAKEYQHPLVGDKYWLWPTYNFASALDDHLMGVTHILRAREHSQNTTKQSFLYKHFGWEMPTVIHFGRLKLEGMKLSKSLLREKGRDAPGTLYWFRERFILPETIREVMISVGVKPTDASISLANIYAINRKKLDEMANRYMFVWDPVPLKVRLKGERVVKVPYHLKHKDRGFKEYKVKDGDLVYVTREDFEILKRGKIVRLMEFGNFKLEGDELVMVSETLEEAKKVNAPIIQWVLDNEKMPASVEGEDLRVGYIEKAISGERGNVVQLMRFGFVKIIEKEKGFKGLFIHE